MKKIIQTLGVLVFGALLGGSVQAARLLVENNSKQKITVRFFEGGSSVVPFVVPAGLGKRRGIRFQKYPSKVVIAQDTGQKDTHGRPLREETTITLFKPKNRRMIVHTIIYEGPEAYEYRQGFIR